MSEYTLFNGDCLEYMRGMDTGSVDAVVADPPYNAGIDYASTDDKRADYKEWCGLWFNECQRIARQVIIFCGHGNFGMWHEIKKPSGIGCWHKPGNPAGGGVFQFCEWEPFLLYGGKMSMSDVIRATISEQKDTGDHPCPKPLPLIRGILIRIPKAKLIIDPFTGSGTTGVACMQLGRNFIGCEIDAGYFKIAEKRISEAAAQPALFHLDAPKIEAKQATML